MSITITEEMRQRVRDVISAGLVSGLGEPQAGQLCVEAAICLALGEPHSDKPSCVHEIDREFSIRLNDAQWSSPQVRAEALLPLALAQLGTADKDRTAWLARVVEGTIRKIVPIALRAAAKTHPDEKHREALEAAAKHCEDEGTRAAAYAARNAADAARDDAANAARAAFAAANAANAATNAAFAADDAARDDADDDAARDDADDAANAAFAAANAAFAAAFAANANARDEVLKVAVQIALDAYAAESEVL